jgi:cytoskeletal protein RodZ
MDLMDQPEKDPRIADNATGGILEKESLGEYLRKVRIGNRVDLQKMAKDTRLHLEYLTAIEKNEFEKIPGETYRKIFVKSVAKYLELNPEEIYGRYLKESHVIEPQARSASPEIPATARPEPQEPKRSDPHAPSKTTRPLLITLGVIFIILLLVLSQSNNKEQPSPSPAPPRDTAAVRPSAESAQTVQTGATAATKPDTQAPTEAPALAAPPPEIGEDTSTAKKKKRFAAEKKGSIKIEVACSQDSVYAYVWRNRRFWYNLLNQGDSKIFASDSAMYFRFTPAANARLVSGGREYIPAPTRAEPVVRMDSSGITYLPASAWDALSKKR